MCSPPLPISPRESEPAGKRLPARHGLGIMWIWRILYILYCLEVGVFLLFLPWLTIWDNNFLLYRYPSVQPILTNSYLKGAVLGLGIVNIIIGIQEIAQIRKGSGRLFPR